MLELTGSELPQITETFPILFLRQLSIFFSFLSAFSTQSYKLRWACSVIVCQLGQCAAASPATKPAHTLYKSPVAKTRQLRVEKTAPTPEDRRRYKRGRRRIRKDSQRRRGRTFKAQSQTDKKSENMKEGKGQSKITECGKDGESQDIRETLQTGRWGGALLYWTGLES